MKKNTIILFTFCIITYATAVEAQNTLPAAGGNASGAGGTLSYTIGQVVYSTDAGPDGIIIKGVQQPYEISVVTGKEILNDILLECVVYPNPATDFVRLKIENYEAGILSYLLYDNNGRQLLNNRVEGIETYIQMENLIPGTYFLKVIDKQKEVKIFKIIKQ